MNPVVVMQVAWEYLALQGLEAPDLAHDTKSRSGVAMHNGAQSLASFGMDGLVWSMQGDAQRGICIPVSKSFAGWQIVNSRLCSFVPYPVLCCALQTQTRLS